MVDVDKNQKRNSVVSLQQGTVGSVGEYSVGLMNISDLEVPTAMLAVWPTGHQPKHRNDYLTKYLVKTGDLFPVAGRLLQIVDILPAGGFVQIEMEPQVPEHSLNAGSFCISLRSTGELHGVEIEFAEYNNGVASVEMWPNDYDKSAAKEQGLVSRAEVTVGKEVTIANRSYKILSITAPDKNIAGWIEIDTK